MKLIAYHGDTLVKQKYVERFAAYLKTEQHLSYGGHRGCFATYGTYPCEIGWPEWLALLANAIFEGLPPEEAPQFGSDLLDAVQVGADLDAILVPFLLRLQQRNLSRPGKSVRAHPVIKRVVAALETGIVEYEKDGDGGFWKPSDGDLDKLYELDADAGKAASAAWAEAAGVVAARSAGSSAVRPAAQVAMRAMGEADAVWSAEAAVDFLIAKCEGYQETVGTSPAKAATLAWRAAGMVAARSAYRRVPSGHREAGELGGEAEGQAQRDDLLELLRAQVGWAER